MSPTRIACLGSSACSLSRGALREGVYIRVWSHPADATGPPLAPLIFGARLPACRR